MNDFDMDVNAVGVTIITIAIRVNQPVQENGMEIASLLLIANMEKQMKVGDR